MHANQRTRADDERWLAILSARDLGLKPRAIANLFGLGYSTITEVLRLVDREYKREDAR